MNSGSFCSRDDSMMEWYDTPVPQSICHSAMRWNQNDGSSLRNTFSTIHVTIQNSCWQHSDCSHELQRDRSIIRWFIGSIEGSIILTVSKAAQGWIPNFSIRPTIPQMQSHIQRVHLPCYGSSLKDPLDGWNRRNDPHYSTSIDGVIEIAISVESRPDRWD